MPRHVAVRELDAWPDPEAVFLALGRSAEVAVWLDGGIDAVAGRSIIAVGHPGSAMVLGGADDDPAAILDELRARRRAHAADLPTVVPSYTGLSEPHSEMSEASRDTPPAADGNGRVEPSIRRSGLPDQRRAEGVGLSERTAVGWVGWFGYEFGARLAGVPASATDTPQAAWLFADRAVVFDHGRRSVRLEWLPSAPNDEWAERTAPILAGIADGSIDPVLAECPGAALGAGAGAGAGTGADAGARMDRPETSARDAAEGTTRPAPVWRHDASTYAELIADCQAAIARGDAYQLCLTNRVDVAGRPDPLATYFRLRRSSPTHHGGFLRFGDTALLSASPEQFLLVERDGRVSTRPMKGTRRRGADPATDAALERALVESEKERAENLMIVDLMRNDLARVAELGSVHVPVLLRTEQYAHVHQLVSTVSATLRAPFDAIDAIAAAFPAGSMTGAPKLSAMRILHALEGGPRGIYSGVFGSIAVDGSADLAMVIRSIVVTPGGASIGTGGGITALSDPSEEIEETRIKAAALLAVLAESAEPAPHDATAIE